MARDDPRDRVARSGDDEPVGLRAENDDWDRRGLRREPSAPSGIDFCSNDYLGLSHHPDLAAAAHAAIDELGVGAPSARLLRGHLSVHERAESVAADWLGTEATLLFPTGWHANLAVLSTLAGTDDVLFSARRNHASLVDGCRLSRADVVLFDEDDLDALATRLQGHGGARRRLIVVQSVESTTGRLVPLAVLHRLALEHDAWLVVDEAHAVGLYGPCGEGRVGELEDRSRVLARIATGGKALGVSGAFVGCSAEVRQRLIDRGRSFVFTTSVAPPVVAALTRAIELVQEQPELRERAHAVARRLRNGLRARGVRVTGESPIVGVPVPGPREAVAAAERVQAAGFDVRALRPPTVPPGGSLLRVVCSAARTHAEIDALIDVLAEVVGDQTAPESSSGTAPRALTVTGTGTDVGKTVLSALLVRAARRAGLDPRYLKPCQTGDVSDTETVRRLTELDPTQAPEPVLALPLPASIDQAAEAAGVEVLATEVAAGVRERLAAAPDALWIVEGAGGLLVPLNDREDVSHVLRAASRDLVIAARSSLGTLNDTLQTVEAARRRGFRVRAVVLIGPAHAANHRTLERRLAEVEIVDLPILESLSPSSLDAEIERSDWCGRLSRWCAR